VARAVVGGASAVAALGTSGGAAQATTTVPPVHISWIVAVRFPPSGEVIPAWVPDAAAIAAASKVTSRHISYFAIPKLVSRAMAAQSASIHAVSGATYTSRAFKKSLASAILKLSQSRTSITVYGGTYSVWDPQWTCSGCGTAPARYGVVRLEVRGHRR
jgi:hypothetical protein